MHDPITLQIGLCLALGSQKTFTGEVRLDTMEVLPESSTKVPGFLLCLCFPLCRREDNSYPNSDLSCP